MAGKRQTLLQNSEKSRFVGLFNTCNVPISIVSAQFKVRSSVRNPSQEPMSLPQTQPMPNFFHTDSYKLICQPSA